jgi:hypothetical protein
MVKSLINSPPPSEFTFLPRIEWPPLLDFKVAFRPPTDGFLLPITGSIGDDQLPMGGGGITGTTKPLFSFIIFGDDRGEGGQLVDDRKMMSSSVVVWSILSIRMIISPSPDGSKIPYGENLPARLATFELKVPA